MEDYNKALLDHNKAIDLDSIDYSWYIARIHFYKIQEQYSDTVKLENRATNDLLRIVYQILLIKLSEKIKTTKDNISEKNNSESL